MKYWPPYGSTDPNASYVNGDPTTGTEGSIPDCRGFEQPQREILAVIAGAGLTPSDADLTQLRTAVRGSFSLTAPGYQKLPSGMIMQWGTAVVGASGVVTSGGTVTWPVAFPNACRMAMASAGSAANTTNGYLPSCGFSAFSATTGTLICDTLTGGSATPIFFNQTANIRWLAIGY